VSPLVDRVNVKQQQQ